MATNEQPERPHPMIGIIEQIEGQMERHMAKQKQDRDQSEAKIFAHPNTPDELRAVYELLNTKHTFKAGDVITWKEGLRDRKALGPLIVVDVLEEPVIADDDPSSRYWGQKLDIQAGFIDSDGDFMIFLYDSNRFKPFNE